MQGFATKIARVLYPVLFLCLLAAGLSAQDPVYSQFYAAPIQLNPAFAGNVEGGLISVNYRNQWPSLQKAYRTFSVSGSFFSKRYNSGFGLSILADDAGNGLYKTTTASFVYAYRIRLKSDFALRGAVEAGVSQNSIDWDRLIFFDQIDPQFGGISPGGTPFPSEEIRPDKLNRTYIDIGTGALLYHPLFYIGITARHLNTPNQNFLNDGGDQNPTGSTDNIEGLPLRWSLQAGTQIDLAPRQPNLTSYLAPHFLFVKQKDFYQVNIGATVFYKVIGLGASYRHSDNPDSAIAYLSVQVGAYKIGYSYDYTLSGLSGISGGAHEIGFQINFEKFPGYPKGPDYNDCFELFR